MVFINHIKISITQFPPPQLLNGGVMIYLRKNMKKFYHKQLKAFNEIEIYFHTTVLDYSRGFYFKLYPKIIFAQNHIFVSKEWCISERFQERLYLKPCFPWDPHIVFTISTKNIFLDNSCFWEFFFF